MTIRIPRSSAGFPHPTLGRVLGIVLAVALLIPAFFFLFFLIAVAGVVTLGVVLRLLWTARQYRDQATPAVLEGEYSVEPPEQRADIAHKR